MGLLDMTDDPARLGLIAGLLSQRRGMANPGDLLMQYAVLQDKRKQLAQEAQARQQSMQNMALQNQQLQRQLDQQSRMDALGPQFFSPGGAPSDGVGPPAPPKQDLTGYTNALAAIDPMKAIALQSSLAKESPFGKIDPKDYTPESVQAFVAGGGRDFSALRPRVKREAVNLGGTTQFVDPYAQNGPMAHSVSPDTQFSGNVTMRGQNMTNALGLANLNKPQLVDGQDGYAFVTPPTNGQAPVVTSTGISSGKNQPSEAELTAAGYGGRMAAAEDKLSQIGTAGFPTVKTAIAANMPKLSPSGKRAVERFTMTPEQQQYRQAQEDWVRAKLRKESGAVIADEEMRREIETYFPQVGDTPEVIAQKAASRAIAINAMKQASGKAASRVSDVQNTRPPLSAFQQ